MVADLMHTSEPPERVFPASFDLHFELFGDISVSICCFSAAACSGVKVWHTRAISAIAEPVRRYRAGWRLLSISLFLTPLKVSPGWFELVVHEVEASGFGTDGAA